MSWPAWRGLATGSTNGIGRAIALELARGGADVIVHGRRSAESVEARPRGSPRRDTRRRPSAGNCAIPPPVFGWSLAWQVWGGLDLCVNNAGADTLTGEAAAWPFERKLEELLAVDVTATTAARAVGRRMKEAGGGVILNMGWDQADVGMEGDSGELFAAAKGAVMAFSKSLALSLAPEVRVHCLAPGWIRTAWGRGASEAWQEARPARDAVAALGVAGGRGGGGAVAGLAGGGADLTGQVVRINGGAVR